MNKKMLNRILLLFALIMIFAGCSHLHQIAERKIPDDMVYIPAGWFDMGSSESDGRIGFNIGVDEVPKHKVFVSTFYIDRYEVTNAQFRDFLNDTANPYRPSHWEEHDTFTKGEEEHPVVDVDWLDGYSYCKWAGKRLPAEAEWEKAARGTDSRLYPWGNELGSGYANTLEEGRRWTVPVGSYPKDISPYGVYDMAGNVREWVDGRYDIYPGNNVDPQHYSGAYRILRGGSYEVPLYRYARTASRHAIASTIATRGHNWHSNFDHGFRCAKTP
ncbi:MAG: SUMF1/EgtB/PvdO family nonheme iron enzyme [Nitrospirae bacterium]|nr:SUMF1/EgtB/PvdO family nonheme iron enzyme [Nitrospirota bacterium]